MAIAIPFTLAFQIEAKIVIVIVNPRWNLESMTASSRKILKAIAVIFLLLVICLLFVAAFLASVNSRRLSFDDSDLIFVHPQIAAESNAFYTLLKATNDLYWPETQWSKLQDLEGNTNWDDAFVADLMLKNRESMYLFDEALQQPNLLVPGLHHFGDDLSYLEAWRNFSHLKSIQIVSLHRTHQDKKAMALAFEIIKFGQHAENSGGPIINYLVGSAIKTAGLWHIQQMIADTTLSETDLAQSLRELNVFGPNYEGLTNALKVEYESQRNYIDGFAQGKIPDETNSAFARSMTAMSLKLILNAEKTKMEFAESDRFLFSNFSKPYAEIPWANLPNMDIETNHAPLELLARGNIMGDVLYDMLAPLVQSFAQRKCKDDVNVTATQMLLALKIYKMRHGTLPDSLSELVPEFFPQIPLDDFDGKPFRYLPEKKIIYSVGPGLKDLGGKERQNGSPDYNLPFKIEF
jgi:hypothetical protein